MFVLEMNDFLLLFLVNPTFIFRSPSNFFLKHKISTSLSSQIHSSYTVRLQSLYNLVNLGVHTVILLC